MSTSIELDPTCAPEEVAAVEPVQVTGMIPKGPSEPSPVTVGGGSSTPPLGAHGPERYKTERLLGQGGMGEVRLCKDLYIGREVAMKVIRPEHAPRTDSRLRFLSEAQVQGQLEHPAIVPVHDLGALPDGTVFFTMKRLRGLTLADILDGLAKERSELSAQYTRHRLLSVFATVCMAIDFAHARGVLHRDLKPQNIMLGDFGEVYVLDWGVAKLRGHGQVDSQLVPDEVVATDGAAHTAAGGVLGTLSYMSPEQAGELEVPVDVGSDVFALGAILFEILTGQRLRPHLPSAKMFPLIRQGVDARPSVRAPEREVPPELEQICVRATAQHPDARYASARKLHDDVQQYLAGDRDLLLRRQLAARHVEAAEQALAKQTAAKPDAESAHRAALREAGQALTLDPDSAAARRVLTRLFNQTPTEDPPEVKAEIASLQGARTMLRMRTVAIAAFLSMVISPVLTIMGVRDWKSAIALWLSIAIAFVARIVMVIRPSSQSVLQYVSHVLHLLAFALATRIFGPLTVVTIPLILLGFIQGWTENVRFRRFVLISTSTLPVIIYGLEQLGILQRSYLFHDGSLTIVANMLTLQPTLTTAALILFSTLPIIMPVVLVGKLADRLHSAERRILLHAWNLRQILPEQGPSS